MAGYGGEGGHDRGGLRGFIGGEGVGVITREGVGVIITREGGRGMGKGWGGMWVSWL